MESWNVTKTYSGRIQYIFSMNAAVSCRPPCV